MSWRILQCQELQKLLARTIKKKVFSHFSKYAVLPFFSLCVGSIFHRLACESSMTEEKIIGSRRRRHKMKLCSFTRPLSEAIIFHHNEMIIYFIVVLTFFPPPPLRLLGPSTAPSIEIWEKSLFRPRSLWCWGKVWVWVCSLVEKGTNKKLEVKLNWKQRLKFELINSGWIVRLMIQEVFLC